MKLQAAVIFSSLQNAKFTSIAGYTSCRPTNIESFMTVFGQCINVLNYKYIYIYEDVVQLPDNSATKLE